MSRGSSPPSHTAPASRCRPFEKQQPARGPDRSRTHDREWPAAPPRPRRGRRQSGVTRGRGRPRQARGRRFAAARHGRNGWPAARSCQAAAPISANVGALARVAAISQVHTTKAIATKTRLDQTRIRHRRRAGPAQSSAGGITATRASAAPNTENNPATDSPRASASGEPAGDREGRQHHGGAAMASTRGLPT